MTQSCPATVASVRDPVSPTEGGLYFGHVKIDGRTHAMTVSHRDLTGSVLHETQITPQA